MGAWSAAGTQREGGEPSPVTGDQVHPS
jgi:hypothetical protein